MCVNRPTLVDALIGQVRPQARVRGFARATSQGEGGRDAASPHPQRTRPDNVVVIHDSRIGSPLFLILSNWIKAKPLIGNCLPRVRGAVAVPIDSDVQCIARVRGPSRHPRLFAARRCLSAYGAKARHLVVVPAACSASSPLSLLRAACAPRLRCALEANVRLRSAKTLVKTAVHGAGLCASGTPHVVARSMIGRCPGSCTRVEGAAVAGYRP